MKLGVVGTGGIFHMIEELSTIRERIGALDAKLTAAHARIDNVEKGISKDLLEIKADLKAVMAWMNRSKGWAAAFLLMGTVLGFALQPVIIKLIDKLFK